MRTGLKSIADPGTASEGIQCRVRGAALARRNAVPGEIGVWVFIFGDMVLFAVLFVAFLFYRGRAPEAFIDSQASIHRPFGAINTLLLLTSSLAVVMAVGAIRRSWGGIARLMLRVAIACAGVFLANKVVEWSMLLAAGHTPTVNNYYMYFFVLTAIHAAHVLLGLVVLAVIYHFSHDTQQSPTRYAFVEGGACFWHMVDLLWIVLFALLYLVH